MPSSITYPNASDNKVREVFLAYGPLRQGVRTVVGTIKEEPNPNESSKEAPNESSEQDSNQGSKHLDVHISTKRDFWWLVFRIADDTKRYELVVRENIFEGRIIGTVNGIAVSGTGVEIHSPLPDAPLATNFGAYAYTTVDEDPTRMEMKDNHHTKHGHLISRRPVGAGWIFSIAFEDVDETDLPGSGKYELFVEHGDGTPFDTVDNLTVS